MVWAILKTIGVPVVDEVTETIFMFMSIQFILGLVRMEAKRARQKGRDEGNKQALRRVAGMLSKMPQDQLPPELVEAFAKEGVLIF